MTVTVESASGTGLSDSSDNDSNGGSSVYYANCVAARAIGAAPVRRGHLGYGSHLDRDNDGIGCGRG
ncbi:excalibur calcium-binding domain-containing protein [Streptomyces prasinus]